MTEQIIGMCREIVKTKSYKKIDGVLIDMQSANAIVVVYDGLSEANKQKFIKLQIEQMGNLAWKLVR